jgi:hypothetical protein
VGVKLSEEKDRGTTVSTNGVIERASDYLDIGATKLRELRDLYVAVKGTALPLVQAATGPKQMRGKIGNEWFGPLREEISRVRMDVGKAVEIPHLIQWFRDVHQMTVTRVEWWQEWEVFPTDYDTPLSPWITTDWRAVEGCQMSCARRFAGARTVKELRQHVEDAFKIYGTAERTKNKIKRARDNERRYIERGVYADVVDLTLSDESEDDNDIVENDSSSDDDN